MLRHTRGPFGRPLLATAIIVLLALPGSARAAKPPVRALTVTAPVTIRFGQEGGNIRPFTVTIAADGAVTSDGPIRLEGGPPPLSADAVAGLAVLAEAEGFRSLPSHTACSGVLPDIASRFVNVQTASWHHRASVHGGCVAPFNQLFAVLLAATHAGF